ncbi:NUDIX hydrolase [Halobacteriovorax sp. JY17]|uniref:NUDIX hydrolase n=1 Tax=Halobacteriovorax sp. JY17 TaxID=2014617 RepID=UPI000C4A46B0|nr:NUDIX hydrolase [Halobacteriovorax sp. JY17]PIK15189.1 MAG: NUDIX hydrolase [Halobacteriovorax sp. JY17]
MLKKWKTNNYQHILKTFVFNYFKADRENSTGELKGSFDILECRNWVNVFAFNERDELILVKQYRHGIDDLTLETVAGVIESSEEPLTAAKRELLEETGHCSDEWSELGRVSANPAFMNNYCHYFVARNCREVSAQDLDPLEEIEVLKISMNEVEDKIRSGEIHHSLFLAGIGLLKNSLP